MDDDTGEIKVNADTTIVAAHFRRMFQLERSVVVSLQCIGSHYEPRLTSVDCVDRPDHPNQPQPSLSQMPV